METFDETPYIETVGEMPPLTYEDLWDISEECYTEGNIPAGDHFSCKAEKAEQIARYIALMGLGQK